jgi:hypothetical protein
MRRCCFVVLLGVKRALLLLLLGRLFALPPAASAAALGVAFAAAAAVGCWLLVTVLVEVRGDVFAPRLRLPPSSSSKKDGAVTPSALAVASKTASNAARGSTRCLRRVQCSA